VRSAVLRGSVMAMSLESRQADGGEEQTMTTVEQARSQTGTPRAGRFHFRPLWDHILATDPGLFG